MTNRDHLATLRSGERSGKTHLVCGQDWRWPRRGGQRRGSRPLGSVKTNTIHPSSRPSPQLRLWSAGLSATETQPGKESDAHGHCSEDTSESERQTESVCKCDCMRERDMEREREQESVGFVGVC